jgi:hypothetical protein
VLLGPVFFVAAELLFYDIAVAARVPAFVASNVILPGAAETDFWTFVVDWIALITFGQLAADQLWKKSVELANLAASMGSDKAQSYLRFTLRRGKLGGAIFNVIILVPIVAGVLYLALNPGGQYLNLVNLVLQIPHIFAWSYLALSFWMVAEILSMTIRALRSPLKLKPFTEDLSLGLGPFAVAGMYGGMVFEFAFLLLFFLPPVLLAEFPLLLLFLSAYSLIFFVPLVLVHSKIVPTKSERLRWVGDWYTRIVDGVEKGSREMSEQLSVELDLVHVIQRDVRQIRSWGVDASILWPIVTAIVGGVGLRLVQIFLGSG